MIHMGRMDAFQAGHGKPVPHAAVGAARYAAQMGNSRRVDYSQVRVDPKIAQAAAASYQALPAHDPQALPSFRAMREETGRQFDYMTKPESKGGLGIAVSVVKSDPYTTSTGAPNSRALQRDVHENKHIGVMSTAVTGSHPLFTDEQNDQFRAVHDFFGHAATGRNFAADGEEAAWMSHSAMYSPLARRAMTTETRGQNSVNNSGDLKPGEFATQKIGLIPAHFANINMSVAGRQQALRHIAFGGK